MRKGSITIFLALSLSIMCSLIAAVVESARVNAMRMQIETTVELGIDSIFAEYNRELLNRYDLFFIDTSYGGGNPSIYNTGEHLRGYIQHNFQPAKDRAPGGYADYFRLGNQDILLDRISLASDQNGTVFRRQAVSYMKDKTGMDVLERVLANTNEIKRQEIDSRDIEAERNTVQTEIDNIHIPPRQVAEDKWEEVKVDNPADDVNAARGSGILNLVTEGRISGAAVNVSNLSSRRELDQGIGPVGKNMQDGTVSELLFGEYIADKFSCYRDKKNEEGLEYELEYVLEGKDSDSKNLDRVVKKLLLLREAANVIFLFSDAGKNSEAESLALGVAGFLGMPYLTELIKLSILFAWGYAESVVDLKTLLAGGKVPIMKTGEDWKVGIGSLLSFRGVPGDKKGEGRGLDYEDYLKIFLFLMNREIKTMRCMDMIEVNIREAMKNFSFRMDACIEYLEAEIAVSSGYGYHYTIRRSYGYLYKE